jgi:hypothetical protein
VTYNKFDTHVLDDTENYTELHFLFIILFHTTMFTQNNLNHTDNHQNALKWHFLWITLHIQYNTYELYKYVEHKTVTSHIFPAWTHNAYSVWVLYRMLGLHALSIETQKIKKEN